MKKLNPCAFAALVAAALFAACAPLNKTDEKIAVRTVTLSPQSLELQIGATGTVEAAIAPENATDRTVSWSSDKPEIVSVDQKGNVTAIALGEATITAVAKDGSGKEDRCTVTVGEKFISADPASLAFTSAAGTLTVAVKANIDWTPSTKDSWITATKSSGTELVIAVTAATEAREGSVVISSELDDITIAVTQEAPPAISVDPASLSFTAASDSRTIAVKANIDWTPSTKDSWITATKSSGAELVIAVTATTEARGGSVVISSELDDIVISVSQEGFVEDAITIDAMVGTWHVTERNAQERYGAWRYLYNNHALVMTKESDTKLKISGFAGYWAGPARNEGNAVAYAEFDTYTNTFTLLAGNLIPSWGAYDTHMSGMTTGEFKDDRNTNISAVVEEDFSFKLWSMVGPDIIGADGKEGQDGVPELIAYHVSYFTSGGTFAGNHWYTFNSVWVKHSDETTFPAEYWF